MYRYIQQLNNKNSQQNEHTLRLEGKIKQTNKIHLKYYNL